jgi:hypothetical protein
LGLRAFFLVENLHDSLGRSPLNGGKVLGDLHQLDVHILFLQEMPDSGFPLGIEGIGGIETAETNFSGMVLVVFGQDQQVSTTQSIEVGGIIHEMVGVEGVLHDDGPFEGKITIGTEQVGVDLFKPFGSLDGIFTTESEGKGEESRNQKI